MTTFGKRICSAVLLGMLLCLVMGATAESYNEGVYTGVSHNGRGGDVKVEVSFSADSIDTIVIGENTETESIAQTAFDTIPADIVRYQSLAVDTVTGATITSNAVIEAVADAVMKAGGDVETLRGKKVQKELSSEVIEMNADVVVAGAGSAGMVSALASASMGAKSVIVFEKAAVIGGNGIISGGMVGLPALIKEMNEIRVDNTDLYDSYLTEIVQGGPRDDAEAEIWEKFIADYEAWRDSGDTKVFDSYEYSAIIFWRLGLGDSIPGRVKAQQECAEFMSWFLNETDAVLGTPVSIPGMPWPNFTPLKDAKAGTGWFDAINTAIQARNLPIKIYTETPVMELMTDEAGRVIGVVAVAATGETYKVTANKGVMLATGGFSGNSEMVAQYNTLFDKLPAVINNDNCPGNTGDGIAMARMVGAATSHMDNMQWLPVAGAYDHSTSSIVGNTTSMLIVNREGKRFVDESIGRNDIANEVFKQTGSVAYMLSDTKNSGIVDGYNKNGVSEESLLQRGYLMRADSIAQLEEMMGISAGTLTSTIEKFNAAVQTGKDEEIGRTIFAEGCDIDMEDSAYYAYAIAPAIHITFGGLTQNENKQAVNEGGQAIEGLYAIGEVGDNGSGISAAMADGYLAAKHAMGQ